MGSPNVSAGLRAASRKSGSCCGRLGMVGGVGEGADLDGPDDPARCSWCVVTNLILIAAVIGVGGTTWGVGGTG